MNMIEVKTSELEGAALDWAMFCAIYNGMQPDIHVIENVTVERKPFIKPLEFPRAVSLSYSGAYGIECRWSPSGDWEHGGPLIERYRIDLAFERDGLVHAEPCDSEGMQITPYCGVYGPTYLVAACRAIVTAHSGNVVSVPAELIGPVK